jgi:hypothetical protein
MMQPANGCRFGKLGHFAQAKTFREDRKLANKYNEAVCKPSVVGRCPWASMGIDINPASVASTALRSESCQQYSMAIQDKKYLHLIYRQDLNWMMEWN